MQGSVSPFRKRYEAPAMLPWGMSRHTSLQSGHVTLPAKCAHIRQSRRRNSMNARVKGTLFAAGLITAAVTGGALAQQEEKLGTLTFATSCDPKVQGEFERG